MKQITNDKTVRTRRNRAEIMNLLGKFEKSNMSVKEFCLILHISKAAFHKWQNRYKRKTETRSGFAVLQITPSGVSTNTALFAEIKGIKIYQPVAASYLKELAL